MSTINHTPWTIQGSILKNSRNRTIGDLRYADATPAVRNLIASAPELLEALKAAVVDELGDNWKARAKAAIRKALGDTEKCICDTEQGPYCGAHKRERGAQ